MTLNAIFGILSSIAVLAGLAPYLRDIHRKNVRPHFLSWVGWGFLTALGGSAMLADGSTWTVVFLFANTALCLTIAAYAAIQKVAVYSTGLYDFIFFGIGIVGLVLWQVLDMPVIALVCAILADFSFGLPTVIKTYRDPSSETPFVWAASSISALLSLFAIQAFVFHEVAYPLFLLVYDTLVLLLALKVIRRKD